jgi:RNA polymerase sigma-70 factor (ECF subfamily)
MPQGTAAERGPPSWPLAIGRTGPGALDLATHGRNRLAPAEALHHRVARARGSPAELPPAGVRRVIGCRGHMEGFTEDRLLADQGMAAASEPQVATNQGPSGTPQPQVGTNYRPAAPNQDPAGTEHGRSGEDAGYVARPSGHEDGLERDHPPEAAPCAAATPRQPLADPLAEPPTEPLAQREADRLRDMRLVERARRGELDAFNNLVVLYQDYLYALTTRLVGDREAAEDAVQEAFFSAYRNLRSFRGTSFRAWITRIALNAATDVLRGRQRRPSQPYPELDDDTWEPPAGEAADPEREALRRARARALAAALRQLTDGQRTSIILFDVEGFDYPEIAALTGVSLGTVKSRIHRGRLALRELLGDALELFRE